MRASLALVTTVLNVPDIAVTAVPGNLSLAHVVGLSYTIVILNFQDIVRDLSVALTWIVLVLGVVTAAEQAVRPLSALAVRAPSVAYGRLESSTPGGWRCSL